MEGYDVTNNGFVIMLLGTARSTELDTAMCVNPTARDWLEAAYIVYDVDVVFGTRIACQSTQIAHMWLQCRTIT